MAKKNAGDPLDGAAENIASDENSEPGAPGEPTGTSAPAASDQPQNTEPVIYCGPTLPRKLVSMTIYRGGLPANVALIAEENPDISKLIVPVSKLSETRRKIDISGTEENRLYQVVLQLRRSI
ncbi:MAG: hypothetical protein LBS75_03505 [Synergistaceae bacterium]|jgi:hypothetical protein|nr:hypothetical protein [Synergistaceae bacterium]